MTLLLPELPERFVIIRELGRGARGVVYDAVDRERERTVALKVLREDDPWALFRLKREFRVAAPLHHPRLGRMFELVEGPRGAMVTMELVDGVCCELWMQRLLAGTTGATAVLSLSALPALLPGGGSSGASAVPVPDHLPGPALRGMMAGLAQGLAHVHAHGLLHLDLAPDNILVGADGQARLVDFGLARRADDVAIPGARGTFAYLAPEARAGERVGCAADWYGLGAVLEDLLRGQAPPRTRSAAPRPVLDPGLEDLAELAWDLRAEHPADRPGADEVLARLGAEREDAPGLDPWPCWPLDASAQRGAPLVVSVPGRPLHAGALRAGAALQGGRLLVARALPGDGLPFALFEALVDGLLPELLSGDLVPPLGAGDLVRLLPTLAAVPALSAFDPTGGGARAALGALAELLADRPLVLAIEDAARGDHASGEALAVFLSIPEGPPTTLLLGGREEGPFHEGLRPALTDAEWDDRWIRPR